MAIIRNFQGFLYFCIFYRSWTLALNSTIRVQYRKIKEQCKHRHLLHILHRNTLQIHYIEIGKKDLEETSQLKQDNHKTSAWKGIVQETKTLTKQNIGTGERKHKTMRDRASIISAVISLQHALPTCSTATLGRWSWGRRFLYQIGSVRFLTWG